MENLPKAIVCIDEEETSIREDGYLVTQPAKDRYEVLISAVAVTPESLILENVLHTLGMSKNELSNSRLHMFSEDFIFENNISHKATTSAVLVNFEIPLKGNKIISTNVSLGEVTLFKRMTYGQIAAYIHSSYPSSFKIESYVLNIFEREGIIPPFNKDKSSYGYLPPERDFVRKLIWMYNFACRNFCLEQDIPYVGKPNKDYFEPGLATTGKFNCPFRNPLAALNSINLVHFLKYGIPYFSEEELEDLIQRAEESIHV